MFCLQKSTREFCKLQEVVIFKRRIHFLWVCTFAGRETAGYHINYLIIEASQNAINPHQQIEITINQFDRHQ